jgi:L-malate glycosyltransferase
VKQPASEIAGLNSEELKSEELKSDVPEIPAAAFITSPPGVFLMTDSFDTGGSERQFVELARALHPDHYRVNLGCLQAGGISPEDIGPVQHFDLGGSLYRMQSMRTRFRLAAHLRRSKISIAHSFDYYTNLTLIPAAKLARVPVVIASQRQLGDLLTPAKRRAQLAMFRWSDCVICNSHAAADHLIREGLPAAKIAVIGNGLPLSAFAAHAPVAVRRPGFLRVGMIARMNTRFKNHRILLEVGARLRNRSRDFEFVLVGDGPLRPELERLTDELGIREGVQFLGDRQDIPAILASLDVTVLPSTSESLSNAILESMAAGVPVIASNVGGNTELLSQDRGILVAPNDLSALENALRHLSDSAEVRETLARNARAFAHENFTVEKMRKKYEELYSEMLERKNFRANTSLTRAGGAAKRHKLRVTIVAASMRYVGGQSVQAELLLRNWQRDPALQANLVPIDPSLPHGFNWAERVPVLRTFVRQPFYLLALWRGMKDTDIAHIFSASYWSFLLAPFPAWLVSRLRRKKVLLHYHSGEARDHLRRFRSARPMLARMDALVVPSRYLVDVFAEFGLRAEAIPNIVDLSQFRFRSRVPLRPHLICTRGFHRYYRVDLVVQAFAEIQKAVPEARLDFAGGGPEQQQIRRQVQQLGLSNVRFLGVMPHAEIASAYEDADIFINASSLDNMPVSVLEAFASGTPVASTAPEGMQHVIDHERTGLLSPPGDAALLSQNVLRLLSDQELSARLAANAFEECNRYRWTAVREQWLHAYRMLVADQAKR